MPAYVFYKSSKQGFNVVLEQAEYPSYVEIVVYFKFLVKTFWKYFFYFSYIKSEVLDKSGKDRLAWNFCSSPRSHMLEDVKLMQESLKGYYY